MTHKNVYIVTVYGCDSTPSAMWIPQSKLFDNYSIAYEYFLKCSPPLDDLYNKATQYLNIDVDQDKEYIVIENRVQIAGYHYGDTGCCAKRPYGVVIAQSLL